jgi:hypothetical protein
MKESFRPVILLYEYMRLCKTGFDLTPLDFYFWGHTKDLVYEVEVNTEDQLRKRIADAANQISNNNNPEMLNSVYENWCTLSSERLGDFKLY